MQSIEGTGEQQRTGEKSTSPSCLTSCESIPTLDMSVGRSPKDSMNDHGQSSPTTSIISSISSKETRIKDWLPSRSTTPEIDFPSYLHGLDRRDQRVKSYKKVLIAELRTIKVEVSGLKSNNENIHEAIPRRLCEDRSNKIEGRLAELVMQLEAMLVEGLITRKDKIFQLASDCVPPETDCPSTAMDLRSLLSQMQSDGLGTSPTGQISLHSNTEAKSTTQRVGESDMAQGGGHLNQRPDAALVCDGKRLPAISGRSEGETNMQAGDVKVGNIAEKLSIETNVAIDSHSRLQPCQCILWKFLWTSARWF